MTYYKVGWFDDEILRSIMVTGRAEVCYPRNDWAYPPEWLANEGYGLTVFNNLGSAARFQSTYGGEIWECEIGKKWPLKPRRRTTDLHHGRFSGVFGVWPPGTVTTSRVKITELIHPEDIKRASDI